MVLADPNIGFVTVEEESTYGTDPNSSPTALNIREQPSWTINREMINSTRVKDSVGGDPHTEVGVAVDFEFQTTVSHLPFTDSAVPALQPVMRAAGLDETQSGSTTNTPRTVEYSPSGRSHSSMTVKMYLADHESTTDYTLLTITGARCTLTFTYGVAQEILLDVSGRGLMDNWDSFDDLSADEPSSYHDGNTIFNSPNQSFSYGSVSGNIANWEFSTAYTLADVENATSSDTVDKVFLSKGTEERHEGSFDSLVESIGASNDSKDILRNSTETTMDLNINDGSGPSSGAHWDFQASNAQLTEATMEEADRYMRFQNTFMCNESSPGNDDDFTITWETYS